MSKKTIINDKNLILTDALLCSFLEREAKSVGVTLEEYVDRFLSVFYSDPNGLYNVLTENKGHCNREA